MGVSTHYVFQTPSNVLIDKCILHYIKRNYAHVMPDLTNLSWRKQLLKTWPVVKGVLKGNLMEFRVRPGRSPNSCLWRKSFGTGKSKNKANKPSMLQGPRDQLIPQAPPAWGHEALEAREAVFNVQRFQIAVNDPFIPAHDLNRPIRGVARHVRDEERQR